MSFTLAKKLIKVIPNYAFSFSFLLTSLLSSLFSFSGPLFSRLASSFLFVLAGWALFVACCCSLSPFLLSQTCYTSLANPVSGFFIMRIKKDLWKGFFFILWESSEGLAVSVVKEVVCTCAAQIEKIDGCCCCRIGCHANTEKWNAFPFHQI
jgi:hypothetical protein